MMSEEIKREAGGSVDTEPESAAQLRREAVKARALADAAFGEEEHRRLSEVATTLEQEANAITAALARRRKSESRS